MKKSRGLQQHAGDVLSLGTPRQCTRSLAFGVVSARYQASVSTVHECRNDARERSTQT